ncbi:hypothetical protein Lal_00000622 [Lupinus albus]|nr:hypothetical protein Lal_00000622 [Lupinus albus]
MLHFGGKVSFQPSLGIINKGKKADFKLIIVQPQNKKKKQSIETRATDSNAVTILHTNSSITETLMSPDHLNNLRGDHLGVMYDATIPGHRVMEEPPENSNINHRNADAIRLLCFS